MVVLGMVALGMVVLGLVVLGMVQVPGRHVTVGNQVDIDLELFNLFSYSDPL